MKQITLNECIRMMEIINKSKDWNCYFKNGRLVLESRFYIIKEVNNDGND